MPPCRAGAERCCSPAGRDRGRGSPHTTHRKGCDGVYFGRGMAGLSFSKQLYLLGVEMMGVGPFLSPLPHLLTWCAHTCISWSSDNWTPHLPHPNTCCLGFSSLLTSVIWLGTSRGWEQFVTGCSCSARHNGALVSNLPASDTNERCQHGTQSHLLTRAAGRRARSLCRCRLIC